MDNSAKFEVADLMKLSEWRETKGKNIFHTSSSLEWFIRQNREALITSGQYIPRGGPTEALVGPSFSAIVVELMQQDAISNLKKESA